MEHTRTRTTSIALPGRAAMVLAVAGFVAACGGGAASNPPATNPPAATAAPTTAAETSGTATAAAGLTLTLREHATLGMHVTGTDYKSLYVFTPDEGDTSACTGDCPTTWPPLVVDDIADVAAGAGVTGELGTITRDDGSLQVTLGGNPLYYFSGDSAAGQTNGQGLFDLWYIAAADGSGIGAPAAGGGRNY